MGQLNISKRQGGLGRKKPQKDMVSGFMMGMGAVAPTGLAVNTTSTKLTNVEAVADLGINAAYDTANNVLVYHHLKEFFRKNPDGECFVRLATQGTTLTAMCDKANAHLIQMIEDAKGEIRQAGVVLNPAVGYAPTLTGGLDGDVLTAVPKAQEVADESEGKKRPVFVVIEGRSFNGTVGAATDLRTLASNNVGVVIAQDPVTAATHAINNKYAAVGTCLGTISSAVVSENIGWTEKFDLVGLADNVFVEANLSNNLKAASFEADYETLTEKGYIFARDYPQQPGVFFDDFPTCQLITSDYAYGENIRTINKAIRLIYDALFPTVNAPFKLDPTAGKLDHEVAKSLEAQGDRAVREMEINNEISGRDVYVDPDRDVRSNGILVKFSIVDIFTGRSIEASVGFVINI